MKKREIVAEIAFVIGVFISVWLWWNFTDYQIEGVLFGGIVGYILFLWVFAMGMALADSYRAWKSAEKQRKEKIKLRRKRRAMKYDNPLADRQEDIWIEISLDKVS